MTDPGLATLPEVLHPATVGEHLTRVLPGHLGTIQHIGFQVLKHHPGRRCTIEITVRAARGQASLVGKVYASDRSDVYQAMQAIRRSGFGPEEALSIPEPLAYVPELRLLLQEHVRGPRAKVIVLAPDEADRTRAAGRAARWLAKFHAVAPRTGRPAELTEQLEAVERWSQRIARLGEPVAGQARRLARRLGEEAPPTYRGDLCAGHGSYDCHQIILAEGRTVTVDWDGYDVADPCRDVARFVVALQRLAAKYCGSIRALDAAAEVFVRTYRMLSPLDVGPNLAWHSALTCLRLAKYEANRPVCTFPGGIEALLHEGLRVLEDCRVLNT
jgi:aminoglycoside phosphotransferase (APT) family kinase protein